MEDICRQQVRIVVVTFFHSLTSQAESSVWDPRRARDHEHRSAPASHGISHPAGRSISLDSFCMKLSRTM